MFTFKLVICPAHILRLISKHQIRQIVQLVQTILWHALKIIIGLSVKLYRDKASDRIRIPQHPQCSKLFIRINFNFCVRFSKVFLLFSVPVLRPMELMVEASPRWVDKIIANRRRFFPVLWIQNELFRIQEKVPDSDPRKISGSDPSYISFKRK